MATRIQTTVKQVPGKIFDFSGRKKILAVVQGIGDSHNTEYKIWKDEGDSVLTALTIGQHVTIEEHTSGTGKAYYEIVQTHIGDNNPQNLETLRETQNLLIQGYARLYARTWEYVEKQAYPDSVLPTPEVTERIATNIFNKVVEKLKL